MNKLGAFVRIEGFAFNPDKQLPLVNTKKAVSNTAGTAKEQPSQKTLIVN